MFMPAGRAWRRGTKGRMSPTGRVVTGLMLGLAAGVAVHLTRAPALLALAAFVEPVGTLWVNAILMTVVPLVVSSLIVGVASTADARAIGRLGGQALLLFVVLASASAGATVLVVPPLLERLPLDSSIAASLRAGAFAAGPAALGEAPTLGQWLIGLVPTNPLRAAVEGAMLPLVVFTLAFALALTRVAPELRQAVVAPSRAVVGAMRVLIEGILAWAPLGVFAMAFPLAARLGVAAVGALGYYISLISALSAALLLALYPVVVGAGRVSFRDFGRAAAPAQAVAFSTRSSLASLPALVNGAERCLGLSPEVTGFCLPLAISTFKFCAPVGIVGGMLFIARLYGAAVDPPRLLQGAAVAVLLSFAAPGVPAGGLIVSAPVFLAAGLPAEGVGLIIALDVIPEMFRTVSNVTADLTVAAILGRPSRVARAPASLTSSPQPS